jgi:hypothetical protein
MFRPAALTLSVTAALALAATPTTGGAATPSKPAPIPVQDLPIIKEMPDPLTLLDGTKVTTPEQWRTRRQQMIKILEDYEYGHMPPTPGNVKATTVAPIRRITLGRGGFGMGMGPGAGRRGPATTASAPALLQADYRMFHLSFGPSEKLGFDLGIFLPVEPSAPTTPASQPPKPLPILIYVGMSTNESSALAAGAALARGYAIATLNYTQLGADATNYRSTAFFPAYPNYDWNDFSAWAWGVSRAVDYLVTDPAIDKSKILATGTSRLGQAVLLAGAFDERIALSAPVAGGMALRYSGKEVGDKLGQGIAEVVDQQTYWFGPRLLEFKGNVYRLPCDQHWLLALTAPRLFIMCNSMADQYGRPYAAVQTYLAAKPIYHFLNADDNLGLNFRPGGHGMQAEDWSALLDFADQKLLQKPITRRFDILPPADQLK